MPGRRTGPFGVAELAALAIAGDLARADTIAGENDLLADSGWRMDMVLAFRAANSFLLGILASALPRKKEGNHIPQILVFIPGVD